MSSLSFDAAVAVDEAAPCAHCGTQVPLARRSSAAATDVLGPGAFCCDACELVHGMIAAEGLGQYYAYRDAPNLRPAKTTGREYGELDHESFRARYVKEEGGIARTELCLEGVHCTACVWLVEKLPRIVPGVVASRLDFARATIEVSWEPERVQLSTIARKLDRLGYPPHPSRGRAAREADERESRRLLVKIGVTGALAGNLMLLALALYSGAGEGIDPEFGRTFRWVSLVLVTASFFFGGGVFFRGAREALRTRTPHMDLPIAIGIFAGYVHGVVSTLRGVGEPYFDSLGVLIFLLLVGRWLKRKGTRMSSDAAELLFALSPTVARRVDRDGRVVEVPIEAVQLGDRLEVQAGQSIPADGQVVAGLSEIDRSLLTGESRPEVVGPGDRVHAGTTNVAGRLELVATAAGEDTRVARLMKLVEGGAREKPRVVELADRLAGTFVVVVLAIAGLTLAGWLLVDPSVAVDRMVAVLVVSCPCALGMATPLAMATAVGRAARRGILIKRQDVLERLTVPSRIFFDKTGTLTTGRPRLVDRSGDLGALPAVHAILAESTHPVARGILGAEGAPPAAARPTSRREVPGEGVTAELDGDTWFVGSPAGAARRGAILDGAGTEELARRSDEGDTPVVVARGAEVVLVLWLRDVARPGAREALAALAGHGHRPAVLSGDHPGVVRRLARELGVDEAEGGAGPEAKLARIRREHPAVMIGDGTNDAAALAAASVGVAVHGGAEASLHAADVFVTHEGLAPLGELFEGARHTMATVRQNLGFSLAYNVIGVGLAVAGLIGPLGAAVLMPLSSLTVVFNSLRSPGFRGPHPGGREWK